MVLKPHSVSVAKSYCSKDKLFASEKRRSLFPSRCGMIRKIKWQILSHIDFCFLQNLISSRFWQINKSRCKWRKKNTIKTSEKTDFFGQNLEENNKKIPGKEDESKKLKHDTKLHYIFYKELNSRGNSIPFSIKVCNEVQEKNRTSCYQFWHLAKRTHLNCKE